MMDDGSHSFIFVCIVRVHNVTEIIFLWSVLLALTQILASATTSSPPITSILTYPLQHQILHLPTHSTLFILASPGPLR